MDDILARLDRVEAVAAEAKRRIEAVEVASGVAAPVRVFEHPRMVFAESGGDDPKTVTLELSDAAGGNWSVDFGDGPRRSLVAGERTVTHTFLAPGVYTVRGFVERVPGDQLSRVGASPLMVTIAEPLDIPDDPAQYVESPVVTMPDAGPFVPAIDPRLPAGVYGADGVLIEQLGPESNLLPLLRRHARRTQAFTLRLNPAHPYRMMPVPGADNIDMGDASVTIDSLDDGSGRLAMVEYMRGENGSYGAFWQRRNGSCALRLAGVDFYPIGRTSQSFISGIRMSGSGFFEAVDSRIRGFRNNLDFDNNDDSQPGFSINLRNVSLYNAWAWDRDFDDPATIEEEDGSPSNGLFAANYANISVKNCLIHHNGWRADGATGLWGSPYSHGLYLRGTRNELMADRTVIENCLISDSGANAVQGRMGVTVRGCLMLANPFGVTLTNGVVEGNAFVSNAYCWPRDGVKRDGQHNRYADRGDRPIKADHRHHGGALLRHHGEVRLSRNVFADSEHSGFRAPVERDLSAGSPGTLVDDGGVALNWHDFQLGTPLNPRNGQGATRTMTDDRMSEEMNETVELLDSLLVRGRSEVVDVSDRVAAYMERALVGEGVGR